MIKVLLVCDFYEPKKIPNEVFSVKKNITLFPISNVPLIEYIMEHLYKNNFLDIILVGSSLCGILEYLKRTKYYRIMRIDSLKNDYTSFGDIMRDIDEKDLRFDNLLVYYANTFANFDLNFFYRKHLEFQKSEKKLICTTILLEDNSRNTNHVFACSGRNIIYSNEHNKKGNFDLDIWPLLEKHKNIDFISHLSKSRIFILSSEMFSLFAEYFDCKTLEDVINSLFLLNAYGYKIFYIDSQEIPLFTHKKIIKEKQTIDHMSLNSLSFTSKIISRVTERKTFSEPDEDNKLIQLATTYGKSITTIQDYFDINSDFRKLRQSPFSFENYIDFDEKEYKAYGNNYIIQGMNVYGLLDHSILGNSEIRENSSIKSSNICNGCVVDANIQNCILWDDVCVDQNLSECLVISNDENGIIYLDKIEDEEDSDIKSDENAENTFFIDVIEYLQSMYERMDEVEIDIDVVLRHINLLRISWNASNLDLVEAFGMFLCKTYDSNDFENTIIKTSCFFPIIHGLTDDPNAQDLLLTSLNEHLKEEDLKRKKEFVIRYGFIFLEDGLITRSVIKKYRHLMRKNRI